MYARKLDTRAWGRILVFAATALIWEGFAGAQGDSERSYFVDGTGTPMLTNQPHHYRHRAEYREVKLQDEPILLASSTEPVVLSGRRSILDYLTYARRYAALYGVDEAVIVGIIRCESNFKPRARSKVGACGLMQLMPATAAELNVSDVYDPEQNIAAGTRYFAKMMRLFDNDLELALAAYNAGPGTVQKYGGVPPFRQTRVYVRRVQEYAEKFASGDIELRYLMRRGRGPRRADVAIAPKPAVSSEKPAEASEQVVPKTSLKVTPQYLGPTVQIYFTNGIVLRAKSVRVDGYNYYIEVDTKKFSVPRSHIRRVVRDARSEIQGPHDRARSH